MKGSNIINFNSIRELKFIELKHLYCPIKLISRLSEFKKRIDILQ